MSEHLHSTLTCEDFLDRAAAVSLDVAEPDDYRLVEEHASVCPDCGRHLERFRQVAASLGLVVPQVEPPATLRQRVVDAVAHEPRAATRGLLRFAPRPWRVSPPWAAAAAALVFSIAAVAWAASLQGQITALQNDAQAARERAARYDRVVEVLASDKLAIRPLRPALQNVSSAGIAYMDPSSGTGMVMCRNLPPVPQGHAYQVWFVRGSERVSAGLLWPDHYGNGYTLIQVPKDLQSFDSLGLTDEPGTGSSSPTTPRVIGTPLKETDQ